jgi:peptide/nickel transport system substrate-binding protein
LPNNHAFDRRDLNRDPEVRDLILRGNSEFDEAERLPAYAAALALIAERAYVLPLYAAPQHFVAARDLVFVPRRDTLPRFYEMEWR